MTTTPPADTVAPTRRERQRQATYEEIVEVSRRLLPSGDVLSLRAVAAEMGMTAPALYRYVDSHQELLLLVCRSIFRDVVDTLVAARDRQPDDDPAAQILASAISFRQWALSHREEFGLLFANPATGHDGEPDEGVIAFASFFGDIYRRLWDRYSFGVPADDELDPEVLVSLTTQREAGMLPCDFPGMPIGVSWVFIRAWARLYGTVTLEVFKHMDVGVIGSAALFRAMLEDNARDLAFDDDWPRLQAMMTAELDRTVDGPDSLTT
ncbi:MAG: TetR/AcrR family transcriptional regulator [Nocardioidaceae bacterium]|nr:TetR/AcrR family transcriptional regulator [Nocardioidaceae bacterium]